METILHSAKKISDEIIKNRRTFHKNPETVFALDKTVQHVMAELKNYGYSPEKCGKAGVTCTVGKGGKTILLRADMDALPIEEATGLEYASTNGSCHACGHDAHTAMLLGAAKILKQKEKDLKGTVKFMFQPAEEKLAGAADMVEAGILENPKVDVAMAIHVMTGINNSDSGVFYHLSGPMSFSADCIRITVKGLDAHGSTPNLGVDAILTSAQILSTLQNVIAKEVSCGDEAVLIMGKINGGTAENILPGHCEMMGTMRSTTPEMRAFIKKRVVEISEGVAIALRAEAKVEFVYGVPPLINDKTLVESLVKGAAEIIGEENVKLGKKLSGSEDFCIIGEKVPSALFMLGVGNTEEGYKHGLHHPAFIINEEVLYKGAALYAGCAEYWLRENS